MRKSMLVLMGLLFSLSAQAQNCGLLCDAFSEEPGAGKCTVWAEEKLGMWVLFSDLPEKGSAKQELMILNVASCFHKKGVVAFAFDRPKKNFVCEANTGLLVCNPLKHQFKTLGKSHQIYPVAVK